MNRRDRPPTDDVHDLVVSNMPLARRIARRYARGDAGDADLQQVALLGLVLAAGRYDPAVGPFQPYAVATVSGEVKRHLRDTGWSLRVSRSLQERSQRVERAEVELASTLKRSPTPGEIATHLDCSVEDVIAAARAREARFADPIDDRHAEADNQDPALAISVRQAIAQLDAEDQVLLGFQFVEELTQREVATRLGISQTQVHRRTTAARNRLRAALEMLGVAP